MTFLAKQAKSTTALNIWNIHMIAKGRGLPKKYYEFLGLAPI